MDSHFQPISAADNNEAQEVDEPFVVPLKNNSGRGGISDVHESGQVIGMAPFGPLMGNVSVRGMPDCNR